MTTDASPPSSHGKSKAALEYLDRVDHVMKLGSVLRDVDAATAHATAPAIASHLDALSSWGAAQKAGEDVRRAAIAYLTASYAGFDLSRLKPALFGLLERLEAVVLQDVAPPADA